jgi:RNA recognition motif. (a.k.a. RRM, RBD, or RNP domain)
MYLEYGSQPNRSPSSSRPGYNAAGAFQSGLSLPRQSQRQFDGPLGSSALYPAERLTGGYNARGLDQMSSGNGMAPGGYMLDGSQPWNYNASSVATVNGAMNGGGRQRSVNRRAALPSVGNIHAMDTGIRANVHLSQTWTDPTSLGMHAPLQPFSQAGLAGNMHLSNGGLRVDQGMPNGASDFRYNPTSSLEDQLIPTAIVIKNIPFAVRKETLAAMMQEMHLPVPYAFNYHFDGGVFRGLAFANFQSPEDTRVVIDAMNGMEVHGRKLRVEYKKMLPADERERIEREKRERRGQLEEQHRAPMLSHQGSVQSLNMGSQNPANLSPMSKFSPTGLRTIHS